MGSSNNRSGGYGFRWVGFLSSMDLCNTEGLNSSCVGANRMDEREHGAPSEQPACTRVTRRAWIPSNFPKSLQQREMLPLLLNKAHWDKQGIHRIT